MTTEEIAKQLDLGAKCAERLRAEGYTDYEIGTGGLLAIRLCLETTARAKGDGGKAFRIGKVAAVILANAFTEEEASK